MPSPKSPTTPFDPLDSTATDSGGDEVPYDRSMVIGELLALEFDDDQPYTRAELDKLDDDQLIDLYDSEMFGSEGADAPPEGDDADEGDFEDEEVECSICGVTKVCDFEDDLGEPICAECEELGDDEEVESADEIVESETEEEGEDDGDDIDETEES